MKEEHEMDISKEKERLEKIAEGDIEEQLRSVEERISELEKALESKEMSESDQANAANLLEQATKRKEELLEKLRKEKQE